MNNFIKIVQINMKKYTHIGITITIFITIFIGGFVLTALLTPDNHYKATIEEVKSDTTNHEFKVGDIVCVPSLSLTGVVNEIRFSRKRAEVLWQTGVMNQYSIDTNILKKVE